MTTTKTPIGGAKAQPSNPARAEMDLRAEAAEEVRKYRMTRGRWPPVMSWAEWERAGSMRAAKDRCTLVEGIKREGYVHPYASLSDPGKRGTPGVQSSLALTKKQLAERAGAWAQFKGISVVEAFKYLGVS